MQIVVKDKQNTFDLYQMHVSSNNTRVEWSNNLSNLCHKRSNPHLESLSSRLLKALPSRLPPSKEVPRLSGPVPTSACTHFPHSFHKKKTTPKKIVFLWNFPSCNLCVLHYRCCQLHKSPDTFPDAEQLVKMQIKDADMFFRYHPRTSGSALQGARAIKAKRKIPFKQSGLWQAEA